MAFRTNDSDSLRTLDFSAPSLTVLSDEKTYPYNKQASSSVTSMSNHPRTSRPPSVVKETEHDPTIDKFSTLFTPSTPRASPTLFPVATQPSSRSRSQVQKEHSTTDDHGSFISVSANEDPLSLLSSASSNSSLHTPPTFEWDNNDDDELSKIPVLTPVLSRPPSVSAVLTSPQPSYTLNSASLTFFDNFAQDAKRNSEMRRKGLMDELLKCENDPLYFLHNGDAGPQKTDEEHHEDRAETFDDGKQSPPHPERQTSPSLPPPSPPDTVFHDLDHDYFTSERLVHDNDETPSETRLSSSHTRSPSLPSPPTLAPPIMASHISPDLHTISSSNTASPKIDTSPKSLSSSFSAKWMSNLLKTGSGPVHGATQTLESIFGATADPSSSSLHPPPGASPPTAVSTVSAIHRRNTASPPIRHHPFPHQHPHTSNTLPSRFSSSSTIKHTASPFGSHTYIPPSGAPGFRGDSYDWDKGFSNELEREMVIGRSSDAKEQQNSGVDDAGNILETEMQAQGVGIGIAALMEKRTGNLDLKGRRASTTPVLSQDLAILLRPHLPALSRLPRSWTLVYSLDQHGISLNTLYTRCEEASSPSRDIYPTRTDSLGLGTRGVLLVIKDAGAAGGDEGAFGAWIADGEGLGMGRKGGKGYFGGGESFLWKFTEGTLKVYHTTGRNNYVALCEPDYISFGGGDGHYGLYLDDTLYYGSSAPCPTFNNEPLCSPGPKKPGTSTVEFECVGLEVWGVGP